MADRRPGDEGSRAKRQKTNGGDSDPRMNPYLAHMYDSQDGEYTNGYGTPPKRLETPASGGFAGFKRHQTTMAMARKAEDGPNNPFTGKAFSQKYLPILKTRRDLPVHAQR